LYLASIPEQEWDSFAAQLEHPVFGSDSFRAMVEEKSRQAAQLHAEPQVRVAPAPVMTAMPAPAGSQSKRSLILTLSTSMACAAVALAIWSSQTIRFLRDTVKVLARENQHTLSAMTESLQNRWPDVQLATAAMPETIYGTWEVQIKPMTGTSPAPVADRLQFEQDVVKSSALSASGFPAGKYQAYPRSKGAQVWEAVHIGPGGEMVSWRGEWSGQTMHGVMTRQRPGQTVATYRFVGMNRQNGRSTQSEI
jgi:hypothetical protein